MDAALPQDSQSRPPEPIARLGKYTLIKALAKGGMAQVFLAQRDGAEEICVLKQLLHEVAEHETAVKRFHREAKLAAYLNHRHIARVLDAGFEAGTFCIAMEYVLGKDLEAMSHHLVKQGRLLPYQVSLSSILGALSGLAYAHRATDPGGKPLQLVHRDLSPRNVMLSADGVAKVIDFGVARSDSGDFRTAPGMLVGTLRYVSPEQAVAEVVDARSDLYSLSVVLHELLTGHYLVPSGEPMKVLKYVVTESLPLAHVLNPELPPALGEVIHKGLAKNREDRWPDAGAYRQALLEAAGPLAEAEESHLGAFVRSFFESDVAVGEAVISFGKERFVREVSAGSQTQAKALSEKTRTGYVPAQDAAGEGEGDSDEPPLLGTVVPVELTSPGASTASMMRAEAEGGPSKLTTRLVDHDRASVSPTRTAMFAEVEAKAMLDAAEASPEVSHTAPDAVGMSDARVSAPPVASRGGMLMLAGLTAVVLGAGVMAVGELRSSSSAAVTSARVVEAEVTPKPVATAAVVPEVVQEVVPEPVPAAAKAVRERRVAPVQPAQIEQPALVEAQRSNGTDPKTKKADRALDAMIMELESAQPGDQPAVRGRLIYQFRNTFAELGSEARGSMETRLTGLSFSGSAQAYRILAADMRALRAAREASP